MVDPVVNIKGVWCLERDLLFLVNVIDSERTTQSTGKKEDIDENVQ